MVPEPSLGVVAVAQQVEQVRLDDAASIVARAAGSSLSARSASTSWARTRSRSSWLAARPKVTTSICSSLA